MSNFDVNYQLLYPKGKIILNDAKKLNKSIINIHQELNKMHKTWKGEKWGELAIDWNKNILFFDQVSGFLVEAVPYVLETDACIFASADGKHYPEPVKNVAEKIPAKLPEDKEEAIHLSNENASEEYKSKDYINSEFKNILSQLNKLEETIKSTSNIWIAPSGEKSRKMFYEDKEQLAREIRDFSLQLDACLEYTLKTFKESEELAKKNASAL